MYGFWLFQANGDRNVDTKEGKVTASLGVLTHTSYSRIKELSPRKKSWNEYESSKRKQLCIFAGLVKQAH